MNNRQLSEHIGNIDDRLIKQAEQIPDYAAMLKFNFSSAFNVKYVRNVFLCIVFQRWI